MNKAQNWINIFLISILQIKYGENSFHRCWDMAIKELIDSIAQHRLHPNLINIILCQGITTEYEIRSKSIPRCRYNIANMEMLNNGAKQRYMFGYIHQTLISIFVEKHNWISCLIKLHPIKADIQLSQEIWKVLRKHRKVNIAKLLLSNIHPNLQHLFFSSCFKIIVLYCLSYVREI